MTMSLLRCLHLKMETSSRCFKHLKMRSKAKDQAWMPISRLNNRINLEGLLLGRSNSMTIWVTWCLFRAEETTPCTWLEMEMCFLTDQVFSALLDMAVAVVNLLPLSWSHWETRESFKLHAENITLSFLQIKLMFMLGEEGSKVNLGSARVYRLQVLLNTSRLSMEILLTI